MTNFYIVMFIAFCYHVSSSPILSTNSSLPIEGDSVFHVNGPDLSNYSVTLSGQKNFNAAQQLFYFFGDDSIIKSAKPSIEKNRTMPDGYTITPGIGAHKLHLERKSWNEARKMCIEEGGHLAIITSAKEEEILQSLRIKNNVKYAYIGVHDLFGAGDWVSVLDQPINKIGYFHWSDKVPNLPDNLGGHQNCGSLMDGGADDVYCDDTAPFFCKIILE